MKASEIPEFLKEVSSTEGLQIVSYPTDHPGKIFIPPMSLDALSREDIMMIVRQQKPPRPK